jgi:subtilase family serine protease
MRRLRYTAALATVALAGAALTAGSASAGATGAPVGEAPALPPGASVAGPESSSATLHVTVALRSADPSGLNLLATQVSTPGSPQFRHFLSPAQVQQRFGPPAGAAASVSAWLRSQHLSTGPALGDGLLIPATGSTAR